VRKLIDPLSHALPPTENGNSVKGKWIKESDFILGRMMAGGESWWLI
jgi:hypothetical protein